MLWPVSDGRITLLYGKMCFCVQFWGLLCITEGEQPFEMFSLLIVKKKDLTFKFERYSAHSVYPPLRGQANPPQTAFLYESGCPGDE